MNAFWLVNVNLMLLDCVMKIELFLIKFGS